MLLADEGVCHHLKSVHVKIECAVYQHTLGFHMHITRTIEHWPTSKELNIVSCQKGQRGNCNTGYREVVHGVSGSFVHSIIAFSFSCKFET